MCPDRVVEEAPCDAPSNVSRSQWAARGVEVPAVGAVEEDVHGGNDLHDQCHIHITMAINRGRGQRRGPIDLGELGASQVGTHPGRCRARSHRRRGRWPFE